MRPLLILSLFLFLGLSSFGQLYNTATSPIKVTNELNYILGIGNQEENMFFDVLNNLQDNVSIKVYAVCESHHIIGITVQDNEYESYDVIHDLLMNKYPTLILYRKKGSILKNDCKDEILKQ